MVTKTPTPPLLQHHGSAPMSLRMRRQQAREKIDEYYHAAGGASSSLGIPLTAVVVGDGISSDGLTELPDNGGWQALYKHGCICYVMTRPHVVAVTGAIYTDWDPDRIGLPKADRVTQAGGAFQEFAGSSAGDVVGYELVGATNAFFVQGEILRRYRELGAASGVLGYPGSNEEAAPGAANARVSYFWNGVIYYRDDYGPFELTGTIWRGYHMTGATSGFLGFPKGGQLHHSGTAVVADFDNGAIYQIGEKTFAISSDIANFYESELRGPLGSLGYPIDDQLLPTGPSDTVVFEHGNIVRRNPANGSIFMLSAAYQSHDKHVSMRWRAAPGENHAYVVLYVDNVHASDERTDAGWASLAVPHRGMVSVSVDSYHIQGGLFGNAQHLSGNAISTAFSVQDPSLPQVAGQSTANTLLDVIISSDSNMFPGHSVDKFALSGHIVALTNKTTNQSVNGSIDVPLHTQASVVATFDLTNQMSNQVMSFELSGVIQVKTIDLDFNGVRVNTQRSLNLPQPQIDQIFKGQHQSVRFLVRFTKTDSEVWDIRR